MAKKKQLISEAIEVTYKSIPNLQKKLENDEPIYLEGVIQRANAKNQNNRIYSKELLVREVENYKRTAIAEKRALGELDHPDRSTVEYKNASHRIVDLWWKGDDLYGKIQILSGKYFPSANILRGCMKDDIPIGFSSRGYGTEVKVSNDTFSVDEDYSIICWDSVPNPSTHGAFGSFINESTKNISVKHRTKLEIDEIIRNILS